MSYDYNFKFVIIGDLGVGKSCLLLRFSNQHFREDHRLTIGVEFAARTVTIDDTRVKLQCWDTAGEENYRSITSAYYRGATCALVVYDVSHRGSFENIGSWIDEVRKKTAPNTVVMLVGNKTDIEPRQVSQAEGELFATRNGFLFQESSAKSGDGVDEVFHWTTRMILEKIKAGVIEFDDYGSRGIKLGATGREDRSSPACALTDCCS